MKPQELSQTDIERLASRLRNLQAARLKSPEASAPPNVHERLAAIGIEVMSGERRLQAALSANGKAYVNCDGDLIVIEINADGSLSSSPAGMVGMHAAPSCNVRKV